ncbi:oxygenase [Lithospermum erythrorhizon]|uniref:Lipoxygenase n=1 Tax=Lithospermum erythrorhizon TaxID=34254 RepID=A0AAV3R1K5_LITER
MPFRSLIFCLVLTYFAIETGKEKERVKAYAQQKGSDDNDQVKYEAKFEIPADFGTIGAVVFENEHKNEMFIKEIVIETGLPSGQVTITCESWVHSKYDNPGKRIFFTNKSYLPSTTPSGLKVYRERELKILRGEIREVKGEFKSFERIYDYDVYNDLGDPDNDPDTARPVLGGSKEYPYPRRCKTNRPKTKTDPLSESRSSDMYVPRDEAFSEVKGQTFSTKTVYSVIHAVVPNVKATIMDIDEGFPYFTSIDSLYNEGVHLQAIEGGNVITNILPRLVRTVTDLGANVLRYETPEMIDRDKFSWFKDEEFGRQTIAGLNPCNIQLVTEWPIKSTLDPSVYGPQESGITKEIVEREIRGYTTLEDAIKQKKLFIIDYNDLLMPYVHQVRELEGTTLYGSRALFFLTPAGTLRPLAVELTRPPSGDKPSWKGIYDPCWDATGTWFWRFAKAHFLAHDSGIHQLYSHWVRTHASTEPYIIAANRQLSAMHPIFRLLHPHFRYTMEINALARQALINANGIIESSFSPKKYAIELSSVAYGKLWRFDQEGLPADLIKRGMAVKDPNAPHGVKLTIQDYPYANDGLVLWDAIKQWVGDYVNHYYPEASTITSDEELQSWWTEVRTKGHADKKDEPWWPVINNHGALVEVLTTIIWVASGHHAAVNFGQYDFAGYFPNRPTIARTNMPNEDATDEQITEFITRPENALMECFPSQFQATIVMAILDVLSNHSPDEEYIGENMEPFWEEDPNIKAAFEIFCGKLKELEGIVDLRNSDKKLKNRVGAGVVPYQLFKPTSPAGVTGKGVPNSISI